MVSVEKSFRGNPGFFPLKPLFVVTFPFAAANRFPPIWKRPLSIMPILSIPSIIFALARLLCLWIAPAIPTDGSGFQLHGLYQGCHIKALGLRSIRDFIKLYSFAMARERYPIHLPCATITGVLSGNWGPRKFLKNFWGRGVATERHRNTDTSVLLLWGLTRRGSEIFHKCFGRFIRACILPLRLTDAGIKGKPIQHPT